jgi:hypothetical protein
MFKLFIILVSILLCNRDITQSRWVGISSHRSTCFEMNYVSTCFRYYVFCVTNVLVMKWPCNTFVKTWARGGKGGIQENFEKAKSRNCSHLKENQVLMMEFHEKVKGRKMHIMCRRDKRDFNWGKTQQMPKVDTEVKSKKLKK